MIKKSLKSKTSKSHTWAPLKGRFLILFFFHDSVSPGPLGIRIGTFKIFVKFTVLFEIECLSPVLLTPGIRCSPVSRTPTINSPGITSYFWFLRNLSFSNHFITQYCLKVPKCEILMSWIFMIFLS